MLEKANPKTSRTSRYLNAGLQTRELSIKLARNVLQTTPSPLLLFCKNIKPIPMGKLVATFHQSATPPKSMLIPSLS